LRNEREETELHKWHREEVLRGTVTVQRAIFMDTSEQRSELQSAKQVSIMKKAAGQPLVSA
jgi:hypothetical protein